MLQTQFESGCLWWLCTRGPALRTNVSISSRIHQEFHYRVTCCKPVDTADAQCDRRMSAPSRVTMFKEAQRGCWNTMGCLDVNIGVAN